LTRAGAAIGGLGRVGELERMGQGVARYANDPMLALENLGAGIEKVVAPAYNRIKDATTRRAEDKEMMQNLENVFPKRGKGESDLPEYAPLLPGQKSIQRAVAGSRDSEYAQLLPGQEAIRHRLRFGKPLVEDPTLPSVIRDNPARASNKPAVIRNNPKRLPGR